MGTQNRQIKMTEQQAERLVVALEKIAEHLPACAGSAVFGAVALFCIAMLLAVVMAHA